MANDVSINQLESHLWEAANILRGPVDAADFKTCVFPLLFFKRLSDVFDEETQIALTESGGDTTSLPPTRRTIVSRYHRRPLERGTAGCEECRAETPVCHAHH